MGQTLANTQYKIRHDSVSTTLTLRSDGNSARKRKKRGKITFYTPIELTTHLWILPEDARVVRSTLYTGINKLRTKD